MQQVLILAHGFEVPRASRTQTANIRQCIDQLSRDSRVKEIYGTSGQSTGCAVFCEVPTWQEADKVAAYLQVSGLPNIDILPLVPSEQLMTGLAEAERVAGTATPVTATAG